MHLLVLTITLATLLGSAAVPAFASHPFSSEGLDDVLAAASANKPASISSTNEFAAMILAVTWAETTGGSKYTPSPMTMGRADLSTRLYSFGNKSSTNPELRAFFHAGIGAWQLDSAGFASGLLTASMISTNSAASVVASEMARRWNAASGTPQQKRAYVWQPWYACSNGNCETIFQEIYNATSTALNVSRDTSVSRYGGAVWKTCNLVGQSNLFSCLEVNPVNAQGWKGSWQQSPLIGDFVSTSPLTYAFYGWGGSYDYRTWLRKDTGYSRHIDAYRPVGQNARTSLTWVQSSGLCVNFVCP